MGLQTQDLLDRLPTYAYQPGVKASDAVGPPIGPPKSAILETDDEYATGTYATFTYGTQ